MLTITDNPQLTQATKELVQAIKNTNLAIENNNITIEDLEAIETKEEQAENKYFKIVFKMLPAKISKEMQQPKNIGMFKAKVMDKFILPYA